MNFGHHLLLLFYFSFSAEMDKYHCGAHMSARLSSSSGQQRRPPPACCWSRPLAPRGNPTPPHPSVDAPPRRDKGDRLLSRPLPLSLAFSYRYRRPPLFHGAPASRRLSGKATATQSSAVSHYISGNTPFHFFPPLSAGFCFLLQVWSSSFLR